MRIYPQHDQVISMANGGSIGVSTPFPEVFRLCISHAQVPRVFPSYGIVKPEGARDFSASVKGENPCVANNNDWGLNVSEQSMALTGADDILRFITVPNAPIAFTAEGISLRFQLGADQQAYGIGEWGERFARIPGRYECWNTDDSFHQPNKRPYCNIPSMIFSSGTDRGWVMLFVNNPGLVNIDLGLKELGVGCIEVCTGDLDLWFICGDSPNELIRKWTDLTGRMKRPPMWSLGFHQCRWSYMTQEEVVEVTDTFRKKRIPLDTMWLDIDYMQDFRVFTWDTKRFSDPKGMCKTLRDKHVRVVTILDPGVKIEPGDQAFEEGLTNNAFMRHADGTLVDTVVWPGHVHHPDFTAESAGKWWAEQVRKNLAEYGISGVWNDMNEPACFGVGPMCAEFPLDSVHKDGGCFRSHRALHNIYGMRMAAASRQGLMDHAPNERPFVLTRAGWAGIQRYSAVWTGDNRASFSSMPYDLVQILSMTMCGVPFVASDIGGFIGNTPAELMVRWMEHGVFLPFCRAHKQTNMQRHEPWSWGEEVEGKLKNLIETRYRLLPYMQSAFADAQETGKPVVRPLIYDYPEDKLARTIGNEFMFGDSILVAPVLEPGVDHRAVYLPAGTWYCWWTGEERQGGQWVVESAPLGQSPVYAKAGSAIAMGDLLQHTEQISNVLSWRIFPSSDVAGCTDLVLDDGKTFDYEKGVQSTRRISVGKVSADKQSVQIEISVLSGSWKPLHKSLEIEVGNGYRVKEATVDGQRSNVSHGVLSLIEDNKSHKIELFLEK